MGLWGSKDYSWFDSDNDPYLWTDSELTGWEDHQQWLDDIHGFRDIRTYVRPNIRDTKDLGVFFKTFIRTSFDLVSIINGISLIIPIDLPALLQGFDTIDLNSITKGIASVYDDLPGTLSGFDTTDISGYLNSKKITYVNLRSAVRSWVSTSYDIRGAIKGFGKHHVDVTAYLKPNFRVSSDISAYLDVYIDSYKDIGSIIRGWYVEDYKNLVGAIRRIDSALYDIPAYIKQTYISYADISVYAHVKQRNYSDLRTYFHGWATVDLSASATAFYTVDLKAYIITKSIFNLMSYLFAVEPVDIKADVHGWDTYNLPVTYTEVEHPGKLEAHIYPIPPIDLNAYIKLYKGIEQTLNLYSYISSFSTLDLHASLSITKPFDLTALLNVSGQSKNLSAEIYPKKVYVTSFVKVALLEHYDLRATLNYPCFYSEYRNLSAYVLAKNKYDLGAYVYVYKNREYKDLNAIVNTTQYYVQDRLGMNFSVIDENSLYTKVKLSLHVSRPYINLKSYIYPQLYKGVSNLVCTVTPVLLYNYKELPDYVRPRTREIFIDINNAEERLRKFSELTFDSGNSDEDFVYFFVQGTGEVYRVNRDRHWIIRAHGHRKIENSMVERASLNNKYIFRLKDFDTMDEAIRDILYRSVSYPYIDIGASIIGSYPPHLDMSASLWAKSKYKWVKHLTAAIQGWNITNLGAYIDTFTPIDLGAEVLPNEPVNLNAFIIGTRFVRKLIISPPTSEDDIPIKLTLNNDNFNYNETGPNGDDVFFFEMPETEYALSVPAEVTSDTIDCNNYGSISIVAPYTVEMISDVYADGIVTVDRGVSTGKYYVEFTLLDYIYYQGAFNAPMLIGSSYYPINSSPYDDGAAAEKCMGTVFAKMNSGNIHIKNSYAYPEVIVNTFPTSYAIGDVIGMAFDVDNNRVWFSKNGVWYGNKVGSSGVDPAAGTYPITGFIQREIKPAFLLESRGFSKVHINVGQEEFSYPVPEGFAAGFGDTVGVVNNPQVHILNHYTESWDSEGESHVWVRVKRKNTNNIYMGYGNPIAIFSSNGDATFNFFDDFSSGSIDPNKWNILSGGASLVEDTEEGYVVSIRSIDNQGISIKNRYTSGRFIVYNKNVYSDDWDGLGKYYFDTYGGHSTINTSPEAHRFAPWYSLGSVSPHKVKVSGTSSGNVSLRYYYHVHELITKSGYVRSSIPGEVITRSDAHVYDFMVYRIYFDDRISGDNKEVLRISRVYICGYDPAEPQFIEIGPIIQFP